MKSHADQVILSLVNNQYMVKTMRGCCDIVARKNEKILLVKILEDANAMTPEMAQELKNVAAALQAIPLLISDKATAPLKDHVFYTRHHIPTMNSTTLLSYLQETPLFMISKKAGITARLDGKKLRELREQEDISTSTLAKALGISTRMLSRYEQEDAEISLPRALKMAKVMGEEAFKHINIQAFHTAILAPHSSDIALKYEDLGFTTAETRKVPFDIIAKKQHTLILTRVGDTVYPDLSTISSALGASDLVIFSKRKPNNIPALTKEEFFDFERAAELIKFIQEYQ